MPASTLVIGVGGTGIRVLLRTKERLLEVYDQVPDEVVLFELDTDDYKDNRENFHGVQLAVEGDATPTGQIGPDEAEFFQVATRGDDKTLKEVFKRRQEKDPAWQWVDESRLRQTLITPEAWVISKGAQTVRPVGRSALYLNYATVYSRLKSRLERVAHRQQSMMNANEATSATSDDLWANKATVFVVASVAGGSGAGMVIDILRMIEHMKSTSLRSAPISIWAMLVGGSAFTDVRGERTDSNTFAALRELDRLGEVAGRALIQDIPPIIHAPEPVGRFSSSLSPADMILLFDKPDRLGRDRNIPINKPNAYLEQVIAPSLADFIVAFTDERVAPDMRTVGADLGEKFLRKDPRTDKPGYFPYASAGIHTLIFPERDVRKSAGLRLLQEIWKEVLIRETSDTNDADPLVASQELWGEDLSHPGKLLTPVVFVDEGFVRDPVCKDVANNNFLQMVVTSAVTGKIQLPRASRFMGIFGGRSMVHRVLALIGLPSTPPQGADVGKTAEQLEKRIDRDIERLDACKNVPQVKEWSRTNLGSGARGNEIGGGWMKSMEESESVKDHKKDFRQVIQKVITATLNDADPQQRALPYRMDYALQVLNRLEQHVLRLIQGDPNDPKQISLLGEFFRPQIEAEARARDKVSKLERDAAANEHFSDYVHACKDYAKKKKDLVGKRLLEVLCGYLLDEIRSLRTNLQRLQSYIGEIGSLLGEAQTRHERGRREKAEIPVRTYITDRPKNGDYKDGEFEKGLYNQHASIAKDLFRRSCRWSWLGNDFDWLVPFGCEPSRPLTKDEAVQRAITWACTSNGNQDRESAPTPLSKLGSREEVSMAVRIRDYFSAQGVQNLSNRLTSNLYLASLCPLDTWPGKRMLYSMALPRTAPPSANVDQFYKDVESAVNGNTMPPNYDTRRRMIFDPANPRHAFAIELALGFKLQHRTDQAAYIRAYLADSSRFALHCMPEENWASSHFELSINRDNELYKSLNLNIDHMFLGPAVVDLLQNRERLHLFIRALTIGLIGFLPKEIRSQEGADYYLMPAENKNLRIRLSKMNTVEEIIRIAEDWMPREEIQSTIMRSNQDSTKKKADPINRLRLLYALRTFILLEHEAGAEGESSRPIPYDRITKLVDETFHGYKLDERIAIYKRYADQFLKDYLDLKEIPVLGHLALMLARVADDLRFEESTKQDVTGD